MTLIITEISELGIVMVADKAITIETILPDGKITSRSFSGLNKIILFPHFNIGISFWGWTNVKPFQNINGIFFDTWVRDTIPKCRRGFFTIESIAQDFEKELRKVIPPMKDKELELQPFGNGGMHICGFENTTPTLWHVHNGKSQTRLELDVDPKLVNAVKEFPLKKHEMMIVRGGSFLKYDGEIGPYSIFLKKFGELVDEIFHEEKIIMPFSRDLLTRGYFWRSQIQYISDLYDVSGTIDLITIPKSISKDVSLLVMDSKEKHFEL